MKINVVKFSGTQKCRTNKCWQRKMNAQKGEKILAVSVSGAGGGATAFYCPACVPGVVETMAKAAQEWDTTSKEVVSEKSETKKKSVWD